MQCIDLWLQFSGSTASITDRETNKQMEGRTDKKQTQANYSAKYSSTQVSNYCDFLSYWNVKFNLSFNVSNLGMLNFFLLNCLKQIILTL